MSQENQQNSLQQMVQQQLQPEGQQPTQNVAQQLVQQQAPQMVAPVQGQPVPQQFNIPQPQAQVVVPHTPPLAQTTGVQLSNDLVSEEEFNKLATLPTAEEQAVIDHNSGSKLPPDVEDHVAQYEADMAADYAASYEVRKQLVEAGVQNGIVEGIDASKEKLAPEEDKKKALELKGETEESSDEESELSAEERKEEFNKKYEESVVVIQKFGDGYLELTDEEQAKVENAKKIRLEEVETVSLDTIRRKKKKKQKIDTVIKRRSDVKTTPIALPASGFVAMITGLSTHEVMLLVNQGNPEDPVADYQMKWSIIHEHVAETSVGAMSFPDFMKNIAHADYEMLVFGLTCATYPAEDKVRLNCNKCDKPYDHKYTMRSLIRTESIPAELQERIVEVIDASHTEDEARAVYNNSYLQQTLAIRLPESGYIFELHLQSANDFINQTVSGITELDDVRYQQAAFLSAGVRTLLIPDPDTEDGEVEYSEYDDFESIVKAIYSLHDKDIIILTDKVEKMLDNKQISFGFMNVECPHCHEYSETLEVPIEQILFHRYQAAITTTVE